jgi:hypothetical protein
VAICNLYWGYRLFDDFTLLSLEQLATPDGYLVMKRVVFVLVLFIASIVFLNDNAQAQGCPMCKKSLESSQADGSKPIGRGINMAILYLLAMPFAAIGTIGGVYYYKAKQAGKN